MPKTPKEAGRSIVEGHLWELSELEDLLGYMQPCPPKISKMNTVETDNI